MKQPSSSELSSVMFTQCIYRMGTGQTILSPPITTQLLCNYTTAVDLTRQTETASFIRLMSSSLRHRPHTLELSHASLSTRSPSPEDDGCSLPVFRATYWALTVWEKDHTQDEILSYLSSLGSCLKYLLMSQIHQCARSSKNHYHVLLQFERNIMRNQITHQLRENSWINPVVAHGGDTLREAIQKYLNYIKAKKVRL